MTKCFDFKCSKAIGGKSCTMKTRKYLWALHWEQARSLDLSKPDIYKEWEKNYAKIDLLDNVYLKEQHRCPLDVNESCVERVLNFILTEVMSRVTDAKVNNKELYKVGISISLLLSMGLTEEAIYFIRRQVSNGEWRHRYLCRYSLKTY